MLKDNFKDQGFLLGLFGGIAIISLIGLIIVAIMFIIQMRNNSGLVAGDTSGSFDNQVGQPVEPINFNITNSDHVKGNPNAAITIMEWSDFQCSFCTSFYNTIQRILADYPNEVRAVYRHFPLDSIHPYARKAAEASECANDQGKFWEYHAKLFENQSLIQSRGIDYLKQAAGELGLNQITFDGCLDSGKYVDLVESHYQAGLAVGVRGTPGSFLNGYELGGAMPYETLKAQIEAILR